jgi:hypothetical protein
MLDIRLAPPEHLVANSPATWLNKAFESLRLQYAALSGSSRQGPLLAGRRHNTALSVGAGTKAPIEERWYSYWYIDILLP